MWQRADQSPPCDNLQSYVLKEMVLEIVDASSIIPMFKKEDKGKKNTANHLA